MNRKTYFSAIIDNTIDGMITITDKGIVKEYNKACEKIFGYSSAEVIGRNIKMLMPTEYSTEHDQYLNKGLTPNKIL